MSDYDLRRRTLLIDGIQKCASAEEIFWNYLSWVARSRGISLNALATEISRDAPRGLSSALRVAAMRYSNIADERLRLSQNQAHEVVNVERSR